MSGPNPNPNLKQRPDLNMALVRLKAGAGDAESIRKDFELLRAAIHDMEAMATQQALLDTSDYGNVLRGFARGYQNVRTMIDDADTRMADAPPREDFPS